MKKTLTALLSGMFLGVLSAGVAFAQTAGKVVVDNACSKCHGIQKVVSAKKTAAEWETTLERMIKKGAKVKPEERDAVLKYINTLNK